MNCFSSAQKFVSAPRRARDSERLMFINAWNESAEGNYLEPNQKFGLQYLEEVKRALAEMSLLTNHVPGPASEHGFGSEGGKSHKSAMTVQRLITPFSNLNEGGWGSINA